ncbi:MAG: hypothetical protein AB8A35_05435, partial [Prochlorococcus sp.]
CCEYIILCAASCLHLQSIMAVNLNGEPNTVGKVFTTITISLALGLNGLVIIAWFLWSAKL